MWSFTGFEGAELSVSEYTPRVSDPKSWSLWEGGGCREGLPRMLEEEERAQIFLQAAKSSYCPPPHTHSSGLFLWTPLPWPAPQGLVLDFYRVSVSIRWCLGLTPCAVLGSQPSWCSGGLPGDCSARGPTGASCMQGPLNHFLVPPRRLLVVGSWVPPSSPTQYPSTLGTGPSSASHFCPAIIEKKVEVGLFFIPFSLSFSLLGNLATVSKILCLSHRQDSFELFPCLGSVI